MRKEEIDADLTIGVVAERLNISPEVIRLYERKGLILLDKSKGNQRSFTEDDIERIKCIRKAINEHKISIEGIRKIQSLIPCWEHIGCFVKEREKCPAYNRSDAGCWTYRKKIKECENRDCRSCKVYQLSGDCENIKSLIYYNR